MDEKVVLSVEDHYKRQVKKEPTEEAFVIESFMVELFADSKKSSIESSVSSKTFS